MMTMIAVFSQIAAILQSSGFTAALVNLKNPTHEDYNSVFWFNIFAGLFLYTVLFFCAPLIAAYYRYPELLWFCRYAFLGFLFANIGTAQGAWLQKNLRVKEQAKASIAGSSRCSSPLSIMPAKIRVNISVSPVRKCFVANSRARASRNCSSVSTLRVMMIFSS